MTKAKRILLLITLVIMGIVCSLFLLKPQENVNNLSQYNEIEDTIQQLVNLASNEDMDLEKVFIEQEKIIIEESKMEMLLSDFLQIMQLNINSENCIIVDGFAVELTDGYVIRKNSQEYIDINNIASALGYEVIETDNGVELSRKYATKRLIVTGNVPDNIQNCKFVKCNSYTILQYKTEIEAQQAYTTIQENGGDVMVDAIVETEPVPTMDLTLLETLENAYKLMTQTWGYDYMHFGEYNEYIENKYSHLDEVVVAVLDSGIRTDHVDFKNRIKSGGKNFCYGYDSGDIADDRGHGTHVSGIITKCTTPNVKILPIKVLDNEGVGSTSNILIAYDYVLSLADQMNIKAINCSFGGLVLKGSSYYVASISQAFERLQKKGISCVVAAGNEGFDVARKEPACIESAITVGSLNQFSNLSSFSNYGEGVDVVAPGSYIMSATNRLNFGATLMSGTSMSAPHIAAVIAMLHCDQDQGYTENEVELILKNMINVDLGPSGFDTTFGYGTIDMRKAIDLNIAEIRKLRQKEIFVEYVVKGVSSLKQAIYLPETKISYSGFKNIQEDIIINQSITYSSILMLSSPIINIECQETWKYDFIGYKISNQSLDQINEVDYTSQNASIDLEHEEIYIYIVLDYSTVKVTVNLLYTDVEQCKDFASYGTKLKAHVYVSNKYFKSIEHISGYRLEQQVFTCDIKSNDAITIQIFCEGDSLIEYYYISNMNLTSIGQKNYSAHINLANNVYGDLSNGVNIVVSILI